MKGPALWAAGLTGALGAHAALAAALVLSIDPRDVADQSRPETRLDMSAYRVPEARPEPETPQGAEAAEAAAEGEAASQGAVSQSRAEPAELPRQTLAPERATAANLAPQAPAAARAQATKPPAAAAATAVSPRPLAALQPRVSAALVAPAAVAAAALAPSTGGGAAATPLVAPTLSVSAVAARQDSASESLALPTTSPQAIVSASTARITTTLGPAPNAAPAPLNASAAPSLPGAGAVTSAAAFTSPPATAAPTQGATASAAPPPASPAQDLPPPALFATAALAWSGDGTGTLDAASLAAIEAFMQPGDISSAAQEARDGITAMLAGVPCARLQTEFIPETGALELRGHIPEEGLRAPVLAALQAELGAGLPVNDNLLILPRPQCGALSGIADVGLPQSTDQLTNPRVVGADAHAREYRFVQGQRFVLEMVAPEYPAFVYVDFFDAAGNVIHLVPNETVPLVAHDPDQPFPVAEALNITIGPPYGQEIAVAFASSAQLYDGLRPIVEPADDYLPWLKARVAEARAADPEFKGEWVYFFVITRAGN